jgi:hypothetical protein
MKSNEKRSYMKCILNSLPRYQINPTVKTKRTKENEEIEICKNEVNMMNEKK